MSAPRLDLPEEAPGPARPAGARGVFRARADRVALAAGALLVTVALVVGAAVMAAGVRLKVNAPPFIGVWEPHVGWSSALAVVLAAAVVLFGDRLATRLPWGRLLALAYAAGVVWTVALASSRGVARGMGKPLAAKSEYLPAVPEVSSVGALLSGFVDRIPKAAPDNWPAHVAGHPPGAFLAFVGIDRLGLTTPHVVGLVCVLVGVSAVVALAWTVRTLAGESWARAALPFLVLFPGAVWVGVSADALFLGVTAWALALLAAATVRTGPWHDLAAVAAGLLLGYALYLSYGFVLLGLPVLALLALRRRVRTLVVAGTGVLAVVAVVTAGGFVWWEAYPVLVERYYAGYGGIRPYEYWVWADLALLAAVVGPATWVGLRRLGAGSLRARGGGGRGGGPGGPGAVPAGLVVPVAAMVGVVLLAAVSGMSKAEVERIWLPFAAWLVLACATLDPRDRRVALALQGATALAVEHLLSTRW